MQADVAPSREDGYGNLPGCVLPGPPHQRNHLKSSSSNRKGIHVSNGSATFIRKSLLPDHAVVTHEITCQGRDHIVKIQSGESVLVVINEHFEPDLILRNFRERLRRIHWPHYPEGFGMIIVDFNS